MTGHGKVEIPTDLGSGQAIIYLANVIRACKIADLEIKRAQFDAQAKSVRVILKEFKESTKFEVK